MIPIDLPQWAEYSLYAFLVLMALEIIVRVWQTVRTGKVTKRLEKMEERQSEILSKVGLMFLMLKVTPPDASDYQTTQIPAYRED